MNSEIFTNTFYRSWHEAMTELSDAQYGRIVRALNEYCFFGTVPELEGVEKIIFTMAVPSIDSSIRNKTCGANGGAPKGNKNALKKQSPLNQENNPPCFEKQPTLNSETSKVEVEGNGNEEVNGEVDRETTTEEQPSLIKSIQEESENIGFSLDDNLVTKISKSGIDPGWVTGRYSYLEFARDKLSNDPKYRDKPDSELKLLFVAACGWEDWREQYPSWKDRREKEQIFMEKQQRRKQAMAKKPKTCPECGAELDNSLSCREHGYFEFNEETYEYNFEEIGEIIFPDVFKQAALAVG